MQRYMEALTTPVARVEGRAGVSDSVGTGTLDYVFQYNSADLSYGVDEYPAAGVFTATLPPWFNGLANVSADWQWTADDTSAARARTAQVATQTAYLQQNVPGKTYSGDGAQQIQQRYSLGMWDPSVFRPSYIQSLTENWLNDDAEFARQRLGGANPDVLARYTGDSQALTQLLGASASQVLVNALLAANTAGKLFICDYRPVLANVVANKLVRNGQNVCAPVALFVVGSAGLMPAAIQLQSGGYWFSPADDANSWLLAKLWVANADAQWWFSGTHLFNTHSVVMMFATAALSMVQKGTLAGDHPMLTLLRPHLEKCFNINAAVYNAGPGGNPGIYQKGDFCDQFLPTGRIGLYQVINNLYQSYNFAEAAFDRRIASRGIDLNSLPVSFPSRDDGQVWWNAISTFVGEVVDASYASDAAVAADGALNEWMEQVVSAFNHDGVTRFTWTPTKAALKQMATNLFFIGSVQHTAVNNSMLSTFGFLPNGPFAMNGPLPTGPGVTTETLLAALPDPQVNSPDGYAWPILNQIVFVMNGTAAITDVAAGTGPADLATIYPYPSGSAQAKAVANFGSALWAGTNSVATRIQAQQNARIEAYRLVHPHATSIPNSVSYVYLTVSNVVAVQLGTNSAVTNCVQI